CHGGDGSGSDRAPEILRFLATAEEGEIVRIVTQGEPEKGMPPFDFEPPVLAALVDHLKTLPQGASYGEPPGAPKARPGTLKLTDGTTLTGAILNQSGFDAQMRTADGKLHLLRREGDAFRRANVTPSVDWPSYHGNDQSNRHSPLDQINLETVSKLTPQWFF